MLMAKDVFRADMLPKISIQVYQLHFGTEFFLFVIGILIRSTTMLLHIHKYAAQTISKIG